MLTITITLNSALGPEQDYDLGRIEIVNDGTGTDEHGNYDVRVYTNIGDGSNRLYMTGRVDLFPRRLGPLDLLHQALHNAIGDRSFPEGL